MIPPAPSSWIARARKGKNKKKTDGDTVTTPSRLGVHLFCVFFLFIALAHVMMSCLGVSHTFIFFTYIFFISKVAYFLSCSRTRAHSHTHARAALSISLSVDEVR